MYIIRALVWIFSLPVRLVLNVTGSFSTRSRRSRSDEDSPLLDQQDRSTHTIDTSTPETRHRILHLLPSLTDGNYTSYAHSWRAYRVCLLHLLVYYAVAVTFLSGGLVSNHRWTVIDSLYFATTVFTTIGYGDLHPVNYASQAFTMFLAVYGIVLLGLFIGISGEAIVEAHNETVRKSRDGLQQRILAAVAQPPGATTSDAHNNTDANGSNQAATATTAPVINDAVRERAREKSIFEEIGNLFMLELPILVVVYFISMWVGWMEGWKHPLDTLYFAVITGTTIGFGDYTPHLQTTRLVCVFVLPLMVSVLGEFLARIASIYLNRQTRKEEREFLHRTLTMCDLEAMDLNHDGQLQKGEFLAFMLVALQKVDQDDINELLYVFDKLDVSKTGTVTKEDIYAGQWDEAMVESLEDLGIVGENRIQPENASA